MKPKKVVHVDSIIPKGMMKARKMVHMDSKSLKSNKEISLMYLSPKNREKGANNLFQKLNLEFQASLL